MLKDINGFELPKDINKEDVTIDYLMDLVSYRYEAKHLKNIIGFARYNPLRIGEQRFIQQLDRNNWYPIEKFSEEPTVFNLLGYKNSHFGLFDHIVPLEEHKEKFEHLKKSNPKVAKYWKEKEKENSDLISLQERMRKRMILEDKELKEIKKEMGKRPQRLSELSKIARKTSTIKKSEVFIKMKDDVKFKEDVLKDIDWRLKSLEMFKKIPKDREYRYDFHNKMDYKIKEELISLKEEINNFDFSSNNIINKMKREERVKSGTPTVLDILHKKTQDIKKIITRTNSRKLK